MGKTALVRQIGRPHCQVLSVRSLWGDVRKAAARASLQKVAAALAKRRPVVELPHRLVGVPKPEVPLLPELLSPSPSSSWQGVRLLCYRCPGCHSELAADWLLAGDPGGLPPPPPWPCLNLAMEAWQKAMRSRHPALASFRCPVCGLPSVRLDCPLPMLGSRVQIYSCHLPSSCGHGLSPGPEPLYLFLPQRWGLRSCTALGLGAHGIAVPQVWDQGQGQNKGLGLYVSACPVWLFPVCPWSVCLSG